MSDAYRGQEIFIVDDDPSIQEVLTRIFSIGGFAVSNFTEAGPLLNAARSRVPACIILDVHLPRSSGLGILKDLCAQDYAAPIIVISGQSSIPMAVEAIKCGALDFIEKPFDADAVLMRVREAVEAWRRRRSNGGEAELVPSQFAGRELLTRRELEVLGQVALGVPNKAAARNLGISVRTVEVHRARIMDKLRARNAVDLMRIVLGRANNH